MGRIIRTAAAAALFALAAIVPAAEKVSVDALMSSAAKYDNKLVTVTGKVAEYQAKTSKAGNTYTVFKLKGGKQTVNVYLREKLSPPLKDGQKVQLTGTFRQEKKVGAMTFKNEIDATTDRAKGVGVNVVPAKK